ncbi:hypothetical protein [Actinokineospora terrae]|uniref:Uncharacterized protein n=1 Tax=Actinokineospora terrae TaxID=155974 RepID=A0A1H9WG31_9PSEU|nr:hypothetical protein [Actinokineospora terrae]SES32868.1 hypothetical protein SAMN04487818_110166 [Actinokineospora terrae]
MPKCAKAAAKPRNFAIVLAGHVTADRIVKIIRALRAIGPGPVTQQPDHILAKITWNAGLADLSNLKLKLEDAAEEPDAVDEIELLG